MKVHELITMLNEYDPETQIIMSIDPEGNGYYPLSADMELMGIHPSEANDFRIEGVYKVGPLTPELEQQGYTEEDVAEPDWPQRLVLWP